MSRKLSVVSFKMEGVMNSVHYCPDWLMRLILGHWVCLHDGNRVKIIKSLKVVISKGEIFSSSWRGIWVQQR